jgi:zinc protease
MGRIGSRLCTVSWLVLSALLSACAADPDPEGPPFRLRVPVERLLLDNGLEVLVIPNHTAPVVTALVAVRAGSAVEDPSNNGYSHLFEHMIFEGSEAVPDTREFHQRLDALGVTRNGTTSVDRVTYFFTASREALDPALELFAGAIIAPALDPVLLEKEKQVVLGEFDLNESDSDFLRYHATLSDLYGPYTTQLDALGDRAAVSAASVEQLRAMHDTYYVPNNALLVLSGDISKDEAQELAERHFGAWPPAEDPLVARPPALPEPASSNHYRVMAAPVTFSNLEVWWQGPSLEQDPEAALAGDLLSAITQQTDHSFRGLVSSTTFDANLSAIELRRSSYVRVQLQVQPGTEAQALRELDSELSRLAGPGNISEAQLETAKETYFRFYLQASTEPSSLPHAIAEGWALSDSQRFLGWIDQLYAVGPDVLSRVLDSYVREQPRAVVLMSSPENLKANGIDETWLQKVAR